MCLCVCVCVRTPKPKHRTIIQIGEGRSISAGQVATPPPYTLHTTHYTLHTTPYTLHPTPHTLHPTPCILDPPPHTLDPTPYTLHPTPYNSGSDESDGEFASARIALDLTPKILNMRPCLWG